MPRTCKLIVVRNLPVETDRSLPEIALRVERSTISRRIWRGVADDGTEFGFELPAPVRHGDTVFQSEAARYVVYQNPEPVLEIALQMAGSVAAGIGWAIGNLHVELSAESTRLLTPDEPAVRALLGRLQVPFSPTAAVFRPGRFVRGLEPAQELGPSHRH